MLNCLFWSIQWLSKQIKKVEQATHCEMTMPFMPLGNEVQQFQITFSKNSAFED